ncbi:TPA: hypothetical protein DF272_05805 [Candidatus Falkowbacteria bacterium]|nr:hypothetical protein [Candidatus Falkowbacteria bacterium]
MSDPKLQLDWQVIGHEPILRFLENSLVKRSLAHAYIFAGPAKIGKTTIAKRFCRFVICEKFTKLDFSVNDLAQLGCGECNPCRMNAKGLYADFHIVERELNKSGVLKKNISIEQIRNLRSRLNKRSYQNSYKVVLIPEAEALSVEAGNGLLKFLEEPTPKTILILNVTDKNLVLPTILSRCQTLQFAPVPRETVYQDLLSRGLNNNDAWEIAALSAGRPTVAVQLAENKDVFDEYKKNISDIFGLLTVSLSERWLRLDSLLGRAEQKQKSLAIMQNLSAIFRDLQLIQIYQDNLIQHVFLRDELSVLGRRNVSWFKKIKQVQRGIDLVERNVTPRLVLETILMTNED